MPRKLYRPSRSPPSTDSRRYAGPASSSRRKAPIGVSRSASRVARRRMVSALPTRRLASVRLSGSSVVIGLVASEAVRRSPAGSGESRTAYSSRGRKAVPSAVPPSFGVCRTRVTDGTAPDPLIHCRRSALPDIAGALRRSLLGIAPVRSGGSRIHSPPASPRFPPTTGSLCRRATSTRSVHRPFFVMWTGV